MRLGILLVHTGEIDRYRLHCQGMLERWASTEKNAEADQTLKTILLLPGFKGDAKQLAHLAEVAVSGDKNVDWFRMVHARQGIARLPHRQVRRRPGHLPRKPASCSEKPGRSQDSGELEPGHRGDGPPPVRGRGRRKRALAEAKSNVEVFVPGIDGGGWSCDWLTARILYREAEGLIAGKKAEQPK